MASPTREVLKEVKLQDSAKSQEVEVCSADDRPLKYSDNTIPSLFVPDEQTKLAFRSYAARTNNGLLRDYNEDRVSIIQKIFVDNTQDYPASLFALFDGHSGSGCADYLRDNLHYYLTKQVNFKNDKSAALRDSLFEIEQTYLEKA